MKPYVSNKRIKHSVLSHEELNFNYRLSRARRCVENSFGILVSRWRCLGGPLEMKPDRIQKVVLACCVLHNFLMRNSRNCYCPFGFADMMKENGEIEPGLWRQNFKQKDPIQPQMQGRPSDCAKVIRDRLCNYVNSEQGSVPWRRNDE